MKHLILAVICVVFAVLTLPHIIPQVANHAFSIGDFSFKWMHIIAAGLVILCFRGGK